MKLPPFEYHAVRSVDEAVALLAEFGDDAKVLAGGQSLVPLLSLRLARPGHLIDINRVEELSSMDTDHGDGLQLGATVRHCDAERSPAVSEAAPMLCAALSMVGHLAIRNRGTVGGSVAHADPAAELPTVLTALGAEITARSARGERTIAVEDLFEGFLTTALEADELLTSIRVGAAPAAGWSFREFSRRSGDFAVVGVAALLRLADDGRIADARLVYAGVGSTPVRASAAEALLIGETPSPELWSEAAEQAAKALDPPGDLHGSAAYRRHLAGVLGRRSLEEARQRAEGAR